MMSSIQLVILFQLYYNTNLKIKSFTSSNIQKNPKPEKKKIWLLIVYYI